MYRSLYWLLLAVFMSSVGVNVVAANSVSDANTTRNFDSDQQIAVDYERVQLALGKTATRQFRPLRQSPGSPRQGADTFHSHAGQHWS